MSAISSLPTESGYAAGTVIIQPGIYTQSTQISVTSPYVSVITYGSAGAVQISCSSVLGTAPCWNVKTSPFTVTKAGTFGGFTLNGPSGTSGAIGIQAGGIGAATFRDIVVQGFTGTSAVGMLWSNPSATWSERIVIDGVHLNGNTTDLKFVDTNSAADFFYWNVKDLQLNISTGDTGIDLENDSQVIGGFWKIVANTNVTSATPPTTVILVNGTSLFGSDTALTSSSAMVNTVHITVDNSNLNQPVTFWSIAAGAKVNVSGNVEATSNSVYANSIAGAFTNWIGNTFPGSGTSNFTDLAILAHAASGNPANTYLLHFMNPASSTVLSINSPGNSAFVFDTAAQTLTNKTLINPAITTHLNQSAATQFAGNSLCSAGTRTITFGTAFASTPVIVLFDETTKGGINLTAKSISSFTASCSGATDNFDWIAIGNPN